MGQRVVRFVIRAWRAAAVVGLVVLVAWLAVTWLPDWTDVASNVVERLSWMAAIAVLVGGAVGWAVRHWRATRVANRVPGTEELAGRALHLVDGRLPTVAQVSLVALRVKPAIGSNSDEDEALPPYVTRDADTALRKAVRAGGMVLLHGRAASGKSRTAVEALRALRPDTPLLVPRDGVALRELVEAGLVPRPAVVWLDDLERFLGAGGLDLGVLQRLCPAGKTDVVVLASIRDEHLSNYERPAVATGEVVSSVAGQDEVQVLEQVRGKRRIRIDRALSEAEVGAAGRQRRTDHRIEQAIVAAEGFAEYLAAGVAMFDRWCTGDEPLFHVGQALISAAVDCRRAGMHAPVPVATLTELYREHLSPGWRERADLPTEQDGLAWACERVLGAASCLLPRAGDRYLASDYLVDRVREGDTPLGGEPVRDSTWQALLRVATIDQAVDIGSVAFRAGRHDVAVRAARPGAEAGGVDAMFTLGLALRAQDDKEGAEHWYERAAAAGSASAMNNLGVLLADRGAAADAERWWRAATEAGNHIAMTNLGILLENQDRAADAERYYREAADAGHDEAMFRLGTFLEEAQDLVEAERWYRAAAKAGHTRAMVTLGNLNEARGDQDEARRWYSKAAVAGEAAATVNLAALLHHHGDDDAEKEKWHRLAADTGRPIGMFNLGVFLTEHGNQAEAEDWYRKASAAGHLGAMTNLGNILHNRGKSKEGVQYWRKAAKGGNSTAMYVLARHLRRQRKKQEATQWLRKAAANGHVEAMSELGVHLYGRNDESAAERWWREAAEAGHTDAMTHLGVLLEARQDYAEAERWWRAAVDAGSVRAMHNLALLLEERAEFREAERWYRKAADAGEPSAMHNLGTKLIRKKQYVEAVRWLRAAVDVQSEEMMAETYYALGAAFYCQDKYDDAEQWWRKGTEIGHPASTYGVGEMLDRRGEHEEAERLWLKAARAGSTLAVKALRARRESEDVYEPSISALSDSRYIRIESNPWR